MHVNQLCVSACAGQLMIDAKLLQLPCICIHWVSGCSIAFLVFLLLHSKSPKVPIGLYVYMLGWPSSCLSCFPTSSFQRSVHCTSFCVFMFRF